MLSPLLLLLPKICNHYMFICKHFFKTVLVGNKSESTETESQIIFIAKNDSPIIISMTIVYNQSINNRGRQGILKDIDYSFSKFGKQQQEFLCFHLLTNKKIPKFISFSARLRNNTNYPNFTIMSDIKAVSKHECHDLVPMDLAYFIDQ